MENANISKLDLSSFKSEPLNVYMLKYKSLNKDTNK